MSQRTAVLLIVAGLALTAVAAVAGHIATVNPASGLYDIVVGASGVVWGLIVGLIAGLGVHRFVVGVGARIMAVIGAYAVLFVLYSVAVPDLLITTWGPMADTLASWLIAGLVSLPALVGAVLVSGVVRFLIERSIPVEF